MSKEYEERKAELKVKTFSPNEQQDERMFLDAFEALAIKEGTRREREKWSGNMENLWFNLQMIRDFIEHQVVGAMKPQELCYHGYIEAEEIIKGIEKIMSKALTAKD